MGTEFTFDVRGVVHGGDSTHFTGTVFYVLDSDEGELDVS